MSSSFIVVNPGGDVQNVGNTGDYPGWEIFTGDVQNGQTWTLERMSLILWVPHNLDPQRSIFHMFVTTANGKQGSPVWTYARQAPPAVSDVAWDVENHDGGPYWQERHIVATPFKIIGPAHVSLNIINLNPQANGMPSFYCCGLFSTSP